MDPANPPKAEQIITSQHSNICETHQSSKSSSLRARLANRISVRAEFKEANLAVIKAKYARSYQLPNSVGWFKMAQADAGTCRWTEDEAVGNDIYFVVGVKTVVGTHLREARMVGSCSIQEGDGTENPHHCQ
jgi:hypothetical protein